MYINKKNTFVKIPFFNHLFIQLVTPFIYSNIKRKWRGSRVFVYHRDVSNNFINTKLISNKVGVNRGGIKFW